MTDNVNAPEGALCVVEDNSQMSIHFHRYLQQQIEDHGVEYVTSTMANILADFMTYREVKAFGKDLEILVAETIKSAEDYVPPQRFETAWGVDGMVAILKEKMTPEKVYEYIAEKHNTPVEIVDELSSVRFYNQQAILDEVDVLAKTQVNKLKRKRIYKKRELAKTSTPNDMFNNTYDNMLIWAELDGMKKEIKELKRQQQDTNTRVTALENKISPSVLSKSEKKRIAQEMYHIEGATQKVIASTIGVSLRTVKYWLSEDIKDEGAEV